MISGRWDEKLLITDEEGENVIETWEVATRPENHEHNYFFTDWALQLNLPPDIVPLCAPTDCRRRPDLRALENGDVQFGASEKWRLEEKQRASRK